MSPEINLQDGSIIGKYDDFCKKYGMDSSTPKSCEAFKIFLQYGIELPEESVKATLHQIKEAYHFSSWTY